MVTSTVATMAGETTWLEPLVKFLAAGGIVQFFRSVLMKQAHTRTYLMPEQGNDRP